MKKKLNKFGQNNREKNCVPDGHICSLPILYRRQMRIGLELMWKEYVMEQVNLVFQFLFWVGLGLWFLGV